MNAFNLFVYDQTTAIHFSLLPHPLLTVDIGVATFREYYYKAMDTTSELVEIDWWNICNWPERSKILFDP